MKNKSIDFNRLGYLLKKWVNGDTTRAEDDEIEEIYSSSTESGDLIAEHEPTLRLFLELRRLGDCSEEQSRTSVADEEYDAFFGNAIHKIAVGESRKSIGKFRIAKYVIPIAGAVMAAVLGGFALFVPVPDNKSAGMAIEKSGPDKNEEIERNSGESQLATFREEIDNHHYLPDMKDGGSGDVGKSGYAPPDRGIKNNMHPYGKRANGVSGIAMVSSQEELRQVLAYVSDDMRSNFPIMSDDSRDELINPLQDINFYDQAMEDVEENIENPNNIWKNVVDQINADWALTFGDIGDFFSSFSEGLFSGEPDAPLIEKE